MVKLKVAFRGLKLLEPKRCTVLLRQYVNKPLMYWLRGPKLRNKKCRQNFGGESFSEPRHLERTKCT